MKLILLGGLLLLLVSCAIMQPVSLPVLQTVEDNRSRLLQKRCEQTFVQGDWQFVHSITFEMAGMAGKTAG